MADVLYTINYDDKQGLTTSQSIVKIGTSRDRVRFVTTTKDYQIALKRDLKKNPKNWPLSGAADPYPVPQATAKPKWFDVGRSGKTDSFHYICGYLEDGKFERYKVRHPVTPNGGAAPAPAPASSLPWPT
jgi:hypothetical protein